ncbi:MAG: leucine-rich repeat domain-containing protein [Pyrinomonadaceae bacterium]|nr:leucine-rich repeat domain-containing protein [Pyrinomonadaceae bacterium]
MTLDLGGNQLSDIEVLGQLTSLKTLNLSVNQISNIEVLGQLTSLRTLNLSINQISDIEVLGQLKHLKDLSLSGNPIKNPPFAIAIQGIEAIRKYFEDNTRQKYEPVYETKVLIVGETETGKTTLFNKLLNPKYLPSTATKAKKKSTVGINIKTWEFPYTNDSQETMKANLWDFGGQEIQYTLHQYFLTKSSFYIFLISNRVGDNEKIHKADYWFKVISALGKDCPVLVILNERHDRSANTFDINKYIRQFGANLGEIEKIDVDFDKNDHRWDYLFESLKRKISNLPHIGAETEEDKKKNYRKGLPEKWIKIREELETLAAKNNYIKRSVYDGICKRIGVYENPAGKKENEILSQDLLLRFLHNLGVIINFEDALLRNYLILNPNWLTKSLYLALEDKTVKDKLGGKITSRFLEELWKSKNYSDEDYLILLNLMLKDNFEIAYKVEGKEDDYVIPMLLPDIPLRYEFDTENVVTLIVRFVFMPYGVFSRLVVQLNNYIDVQNVNGHEKQIVWKKGMLLDSKRGCFAEVIESDDREQTPKEIKIRAAGKSVEENKRFLEQIVSRIYQINDDWFNNNLEFGELIPCNCEVCKELEDDAEKEMYSFKTIRKFLRNNIYETHCRRSAETVNLGELFDGVYNTPPNNRGDNYYFLDETQFIKEARDKVSIRQRIGAKQGKRGEM